MSKPESIQIHIPHPCSQNWDEMTPEEKGRHCAHCQKNVVDFTTWSDTALYNFFAKNNGHVCGRFLSYQLSHTINIPHQPHSRLYRMAIALGLTIIFTQTPNSYAQNKPPLVYQTPSGRTDTNQIDSNNFGCINGKIIDENKEPLIAAVVQIFQNNILKGGTITDYDGNYTINSLEPGLYDVLATYTGYDSAEVLHVPVRRGEPSRANFPLTRIKTNQFILGMIRVSNYKAPLIDRDNPTKRTFTRDEIDRLPLR